VSARTRRGTPARNGAYACVVRTRHDEAIARLREAARPDRPEPAGLEPYLDAVRRHPYRIGDGDVEALKAAGFSEDELFEHTVSAAVGAGLSRLRAGLAALG
jgi:alkylhydroperoxidase family enzyme